MNSRFQALEMKDDLTAPYQKQLLGKLPMGAFTSTAHKSQRAEENSLTTARKLL